MSDTKIQINLRAARETAGLSLAQTAERTGVSKAMLGQIERGESSPTLATLWKLAKGFHLPLSAFIEDAVQAHDLFRPGQTAPDRFPESVAMHTVFPFDPVFGSETFVITLRPGQTHLSQAHDTGVIEDLFVLEGAMEVLRDTHWTRCQSGDGLRFRADRPHGYRNPTGQTARFHNTIHYPKTGLFSKDGST